MPIHDTLREAFEQALLGNSLTDEDILANPDPMMRPEEKNLLEVIPSYLLWCSRNPDDTTTVMYWTLNAVAEYGRATDPENSYLNFKFLCDSQQRSAVREFLLWCRSNVDLTDDDQLKRTIPRW